jgi:CheY-like chemotaxis protein
MAARILLAEDDRCLRKAAETFLSRHGYHVIIAVDGEEALARSLDSQPDLVLLDAIMPKMLGFDVLAAIKANPATAHVPCVMLTNLEQDRDRQEAMRLGASGYLVKANLRLDELVRQVGSTLAAHQ